MESMKHFGIWLGLGGLFTRIIIMASNILGEECMCRMI